MISFDTFQHFREFFLSPDCNDIVVRILRSVGCDGLSLCDPQQTNKNVAYTLPETNSSHPKMDGWNTFSFPWKGPGLVSSAMIVLGRAISLDLHFEAHFALVSAVVFLYNMFLLGGVN